MMKKLFIIILLINFTLFSYVRRSGNPSMQQRRSLHSNRSRKQQRVQRSRQTQQRKRPAKRIARKSGPYSKTKSPSLNAYLPKKMNALKSKPSGRKYQEVGMMPEQKPTQQPQTEKPSEPASNMPQMPYSFNPNYPKEFTPNYPYPMNFPIDMPMPTKKPTVKTRNELINTMNQALKDPDFNRDFQHFVKSPLGKLVVEGGFEEEREARNLIKIIKSGQFQNILSGMTPVEGPVGDVMQMIK